VFDRVVSSYTPSLTALADTVTTPRPHHTTHTALIVGVGEGKGVPTLPNARGEAEAVAALLPGSTLLIDSAASADAIKEGLHEHAIAHFACHGRAVSSAGHPDLGGLMLNDGIFVPSFVRDLRITQAQLAFLSACDTAGPDPALPDEPLNLTSAFHLAGFRGVIGTLWHTADSTETAVAVYAALTANGTRPADTAQAATALTETLRRMRDAYPAVPTRWATHVHVGD
jgi:CHAT domain-containing protein